eukprot:tig00000981_g5881.t1
MTRAVGSTPASRARTQAGPAPRPAAAADAASGTHDELLDAAVGKGREGSEAEDPHAGVALGRVDDGSAVAPQGDLEAAEGRGGGGERGGGDG